MFAAAAAAAADDDDDAQTSTVTDKTTTLHESESETEETEQPAMMVAQNESKRVVFVGDKPIGASPRRGLINEVILYQ